MSSETAELVVPLGAFVIALILRSWYRTTRIMWPLSMLAVMVHELGHGLAALLTGGEFESFKMDSEGGLAYTRGGRRFVVIQAGYVGTAIFGALLVYLTNTLEEPGYIALALGIGFGVLTLLFAGISLRKLSAIELLVTVGVMAAAIVLFVGTQSPALRWIGIALGAGGIVLFVRFISDEHFFSVAVGTLSSAALLVVGYYGIQSQPEVARFVLNFVAFMVGLNAVYDSWYLFTLLSSGKRGNDAATMSKEIGGSPRFWAMVWSLNAVVMLGLGVFLAVR